MTDAHLVHWSVKKESPKKGIMRVLDWGNVSDVRIEKPEDLLSLSKGWMITKELNKKLKKRVRTAVGKKVILSRGQENNIKGIYGETIVTYHLRRTMRKYGYIEHNGNNPMTFIQQSQYSWKKKARGIDTRLKFTNSIGKTFLCNIEVKNWSVTTCKAYLSNEKRFRREILKRFVDIDKYHRNTWILAINRRGVPYAKPYCEKHNILILELNEHYTRAFIKRILDENRLENNDYDT